MYTVQCIFHAVCVPLDFVQRAMEGVYFKMRENKKLTQIKGSERERGGDRYEMYIFLFIPFFQFQDQPVNDGGSLHKKINHNNFRLNVYEYYLGKRKDANAFSSGGVDGTVRTGAGAGARVMDRYRGAAIQNTLANVNSKATKVFDNINNTYDESTFSRCTLLFIGSLCQQGESCKLQTSF